MNKPPSPANSSWLTKFNWAVLCLGIAAVVLVSGLAVWMCVNAVEGDFQYANIAIYAACGLSGLTVAWWFIAVSNFPLVLRCLPVVGAVMAIATFFWFYKIVDMSGELVPTFGPRWVERADEQLESVGMVTAEDPIDLTTTTPDDFPQFLGPNRDNYLPNIQLARDWDASPPRERWRQPIGAGWSGFSVVNGFAVTMEQRGEEELVTCYRAETGELVWSHAIEVRHETVLGGIGPRSTVTIDEGNVYAMGSTGVLRCLNGKNGALIWQVDVPQRYDLTHDIELGLVAWGRSNSPLVTGEQVIVPAGGPTASPVSLISFDKKSGELLWEGGDHQISYASPSIYELHGQPQIVIVNEAHVTGHDPTTGEPLWEFPWPGQSNAKASVSQAVSIGENRLLLSKGYGGGSAVIQIQREGEPELIWDDMKLLKTKFTNVCVIDGYAYGLSDGILECVELETGKRQWKRGRYRHGQIVGVGDVLLVQAEGGDLAMVDASPEDYRELGKTTALEKKTWNNLCVYGNLVITRNDEEAVCFELAVVEPSTSAAADETGETPPSEDGS